MKIKTSKDPLDRYYTPAWVTELLLADWPFPDAIDSIWEPCAGVGNISKAIKANAPLCVVNVFASDVERVPGVAASFDFLSPERRWPGEFPGRLLHAIHSETLAIVTNPPYSIPGATAADFVRKALEYTPHVAMLLRLSWMEGAAERADIFRESPPAEIRIISPRVHYTGPNSDHKPANPNGPSAWFIWRPNATETKVTWISKPTTKG